MPSVDLLEMGEPVGVEWVIMGIFCRKPMRRKERQR